MVTKRLIAVINIFLLSWNIEAAGKIVTGQVVGIADGDTITILDSTKSKHRIRLAQIDAPESKQDFGQRSKQSLSQLVFGKRVSVQVETTDRYKRLVGKVIIDGLDANLEQVKRGMAWVYTRYAHDAIYYAAEHQAKALKIGLWSHHHPIPPWEFRNAKKH